VCKYRILLKIYWKNVENKIRNTTFHLTCYGHW